MNLYMKNISIPVLEVLCNITTLITTHFSIFFNMLNNLNSPTFHRLRL